MATGSEHYTRAEQLLREVRDGHQEGTDVAAILAAAQVHATLALAAASRPEPEDGARAAVEQEWADRFDDAATRGIGGRVNGPGLCLARDMLRQGADPVEGAPR